eukprot:Pgem_evm1s13353
MSNNLISDISAMQYDHLPMLNTITLSENQLTEIPNLHNSYNLQQIILSNNNIERVYNNTFYNMTLLYTLAIDNNAIIEIDNGVFDKLNKLVNLDISDNKLTDYPNSIDIILENYSDNSVITLTNNPIPYVSLPDSVVTYLVNMNWNN